jgi:phage tail-like protein
MAVERSHVTYRHGYSYLEGESITQFSYEKSSSITLKRGIVSGTEDLYQWLAKGDRRTVDVSLCDEAGAPVVTWHIGKAVPVKLNAPAFDAASNNVAVESLEVLAANVSVEHHGGTRGG